MKTLYINLNGEIIESNDKIVVVGTEKDNIVNKFYIALGTEICDGVIVKGVKKKQLVAEFESERSLDFKPILDQWDEIRYKLLSSDPSGSYSVKIPNAYLEWLQYHQNAEYRKIYTQKFSQQKDVTVELDIKQLYDDAVELIISNIEPDDYNILVVNDEFVTNKSAVVKSIKKEHPQISFVLFEEWETKEHKCPKCDMNPCECEQEPPVCSKCGKNPCECLLDNRILFVVYNEYEYNDYMGSEDEPKNVKVFSFLESPQLIFEGKYKKPHVWDKEKENGHDVLALERWDENKYDEVSVKGIQKSLDWYRTVRAKNYNQQDNSGKEYEGNEFEVLNEYFVIRSGYSDDCQIDVIDKKTKRILLKKAWDNNGIYTRKDWCIIAGADWDDRENEVRTLFNREHQIRLKPDEDILSPLDSYSDEDKDAFISECRIISYILQDGENTIIPECMKEINIRDYQGKLIKSIRNPNILIKCAYKFGKALGFRVDGNLLTALVYIDLMGGIHDIPFSVDYIENAYEAECKFVSEDSIFIDDYNADDEDRYQLIDLQGNPLFDVGEGMLHVLEGNYLEYYDYEECKKGVIDGHGNIVLPAQYDEIVCILQ